MVKLSDLHMFREDLRNNGIGAALIRAAKDYGKDHKVDFIRTQMFPGNVDAMRFYERTGFCEMIKTIQPLDRI